MKNTQIKRALGLLPMLAVILLSGCASQRVKNTFYSDYAVSDLVSNDSPKIYDDLKSQLNSTKLLEDACFEVPVDSEKAAVCAMQRNNAIAALVVNSEKLCVDHRKTIYGNEAALNITAGSFTNLFTGLATAVPSASSKTAFSALGFFSSAERSLANETYYKSAVITAVDSKIVQRRNELALSLYDKFGKGINEYTAANSVHDVMVFHYSCSFMDGLRLALEEGTQERAKQKIVRLRENLRAVQADYDRATDKDATEYKNGINARITAINDELKKLEVQ